MRTSITTDDEPFAAQVTVTIAETEHFPTLEAMTWASYDWDGPSTVRRISPPDPDATPPADH